MSPEAVLYLAVGLIGLIVGALGEFVRSYLREKGKNYATREDIDKLVEQLRQTTKVTEEIKAQISSEAWVWQTRWNLKRDLYARLLESLAIGRNSMRLISAYAQALLVADSPVLWTSFLGLGVKHEFERLAKSNAEFEEATAVASIMLSQQTLDALTRLEGDWKLAIDECSKVIEGQAGEKVAEEVFRLWERLTIAVDEVYKLVTSTAQADLMGTRTMNNPNSQTPISAAAQQL